MAILLAGCAGSPDQPAPPPPAAPQTLAWIEKAEEQQQLRQYHQARLLYIRAKREAPDDNSRGWAALEYGRALIFWGEYESARRELAEGVELRPTDPAGWHDLGMVAYQARDPAAAERAFRRSIAIDPDDHRSHLALSALLTNAGRLDEAIGELQAARPHAPPELRAKIDEGIALLRKEKQLRGRPR
ncbi:MAG TPA: tetratricopeptide repeat protein [Kofleriaceae bacterium]|nr:tetratricopeptide repeat protein [Kofleriaceae bacterium]